MVIMIAFLRCNKYSKFQAEDQFLFLVVYNKVYSSITIFIIERLSAINCRFRGFALTEVLLAIAVIVIIGIAGYPLYKNSRENAKLEKFTNDIMELQTNIGKAFANNASKGSFNTQMAMDMGVIPDGLRDPNCTYTTCMIDPWGDSISVQSVTIGALANSSYWAIGIRALPSDTCIKVGTGLAPAFVGIGIGWGQNQVKDPLSSTPNAVNMDALTTICNGDTRGLYFMSR